MKYRFGIAVVAVVVAVGAQLALDSFLEARLAQAVVMVTLILLLMAIAVVLRPCKEMPILCDPLVLTCAFLSQFFVLAPILVFVQGLAVLPFFSPPRPETMILALVAFFLMLAFFVLGYRVQLGVVLANLAPDFAPSARKLPGRWAAGGVLTASLLGSLSWIQYEGGLMAKLSSPYGTAKSPALFVISHVALLVGTFLMAWRVINATTRRRLDTVMLVALLAFDALFFGVVMGVRKYTLFLFFGICTMWLLRKGFRTLPKSLTAVVLVGLLIFFSAWGAVRSTPVSVMMGMSGGLEYSTTPRQGLQSGYLTAICDPFGGASKVMEVFPDQEPFKYGRTLAIVYLGFIPRALWPDKPVGIGKEITRYYVGPYYTHTMGLSIAPTVLGELWVNFGWPGILAGGFLFGVVCRAVTAYAVRGMKNGLQYRAARVLMPASFVAGLGEVRADLAAMLLTWGLAFAPLVLVLTVFNMDGAPGSQEAQRSPRGSS